MFRDIQSIASIIYGYRADFDQILEVQQMLMIASQKSKWKIDVFNQPGDSRGMLLGVELLSIMSNEKATVLDIEFTEEAIIKIKPRLEKFRKTQKIITVDKKPKLYLWSSWKIVENEYSHLFKWETLKMFSDVMGRK